MTNNALQTIVTALNRVQRLNATFELYAGLLDLNTSGQSEQRLTELVHAETKLAEIGIQAALDHVDGEALTALDTALDEVKKTRREYDRRITGSAARASQHAGTALALVKAVLHTLYLEPQQDAV